MTFVDLTTVDDIYTAHAIAQALEAEDIPCIEANETMATWLPHLRLGIQIRVKAIDYMRAKIIADRVEKDFKRK